MEEIKGINVTIVSKDIVKLSKTYGLFLTDLMQKNMKISIRVYENNSKNLFRRAYKIRFHESDKRKLKNFLINSTDIVEKYNNKQFNIDSEGISIHYYTEMGELNSEHVKKLLYEEA